MPWISYQSDFDGITIVDTPGLGISYPQAHGGRLLDKSDLIVQYATIRYDVFTSTVNAQIVFLLRGYPRHKKHEK